MIIVDSDDASLEALKITFVHELGLAKVAAIHSYPEALVYVRKSIAVNGLGYLKLVLVDSDLVIEGGLKACKKILKEFKSTPPTAAIMGPSSDSHKAKATKVGACVIDKPPSIEALQELIVLSGIN